MLRLFLLLLEVIYLFLAFKTGATLYFVIAIGLGGWWLYEQIKETRERDEAIQEDTINKIENYSNTRYIVSTDYLQALIIDEKSDTFRYLQREDLDDEFDVRELNFRKIFEVAIVEDGCNIALTSKGGVQGWSIIDGGTKLDVHVNGQGEKSEEKPKKEVEKLILKLVVDDLSNPIIEYTFLDNQQAIPKDLDEYKEIFKECNKWYQKMSVIIKRYEHERKEVAVNGWV